MLYLYRVTMYDSNSHVCVGPSETGAGIGAHSVRTVCLAVPGGHRPVLDNPRSSYGAPVAGCVDRVSLAALLDGRDRQPRKTFFPLWYAVAVRSELFPRNRAARHCSPLLSLPAADMLSPSLKRQSCGRQERAAAL